MNPQLLAESPLLPRRDGKPMTRSHVALRLKLAVEAATAMFPKLAKMAVSPPIVRHSTAMSLFQSAADPCGSRCGWATRAHR